MNGVWGRAWRCRAALAGGWGNGNVVKCHVPALAPLYCAAQSLLTSTTAVHITQYQYCTRATPSAAPKHVHALSLPFFPLPTHV